MSLAWTLKNNDVSVALFGASKPKQIDDNIKAIEVLAQLTPEILQKIEDILQNKPKRDIDWKSKDWTKRKPRR